MQGLATVEMSDGAYYELSVTGAQGGGHVGGGGRKIRAQYYVVQPGPLGGANSRNEALLAAAESLPTSAGNAAEQPAPPPASATKCEGRKTLSVKKRFSVFKRDRYRCCICRISGIELEVDHKVPVAQGGSNALDNLQTLCFDCNRGKRHTSQ